MENGFGILREKTVDEMLHLRIANIILDTSEAETIILLSVQVILGKPVTRLCESAED